jgi:uncharacterized protein
MGSFLQKTEKWLLKFRRFHQSVVMDSSRAFLIPMKRNTTALTLALAVCSLSFAASQQTNTDLEKMPANSTQALGQTFSERKAGVTRVLLAGSGSAHHFPRDFIKIDSEILTKAGHDVAGTLNGEEAVGLLPEADVIVFSGNDGGQWGTPKFQAALNTHADAGKGIVILHAAAWKWNWDGGNYNKRFVAGFSPSHGAGEFEVDINAPDHAIMQGVAENFKIRDESYRHEFMKDADATVLATNGKGADEHASVWTVNDPKARIVVITLGHDVNSHNNEQFKSILTNAVKWVSEGTGPTKK